MVSIVKKNQPRRESDLRRILFREECLPEIIKAMHSLGLFVPTLELEEIAWRAYRKGFAHATRN